MAEGETLDVNRWCVRIADENDVLVVHRSGFQERGLGAVAGEQGEASASDDDRLLVDARPDDNLVAVLGGVNGLLDGGEFAWNLQHLGVCCR